MPAIVEIVWHHIRAVQARSLYPKIWLRFVSEMPQSGERLRISRSRWLIMQVFL